MSARDPGSYRVVSDTPEVAPGLTALSYRLRPAGRDRRGRPRARFLDVVLHCHEVPLAFPSARPVVAYLGSIREPVISHVGEPLDFDAVLDQVAARAEGSFRTVSRGGVFACR